MRDPRRVLADCSPNTQEMESAIFDFPQPLGPTTAAMPSPGNLSSVRSQKDLNPRICSFFSFSKVLLSYRNGAEWPIVTRLLAGLVRFRLGLSSAGTYPPVIGVPGTR